MGRVVVAFIYTRAQTACLRKKRCRQADRWVSLARRPPGPGI